MLPIVPRAQTWCALILGSALTSGRIARADASPAPAPTPTPATAPTPAPAPAPATTSATRAEAPDSSIQTVLVLARRPAAAASSFVVPERDLQLRSTGSVPDMLRVTPGLVLVQHSGGGKANQYFLRGFDADHGTDLALSVDGVPINLPSHAHGQGFADANFVIPEAIERVEITKGPYFASQGDFATAGAVNLVTRDAFEHSSFGLGLGGSPGYGEPDLRALVVASPRWEAATATFAAELGRQNGPFDHPDEWDRYKLFNKVTFRPTRTSTLSLVEMSYGGDWHGSGQVPARAIEQGLVPRFGSIDPAEGGDTMRHQLAAAYILRPTDRSELRVLAYLGAYSFDLFSNFTLYLRDPDQGDEIEQQDRRTFYGLRASYRVTQEVGAARLETTVGTDARADLIREQLWHTAARVRLGPMREDATHEGLAGAYASEAIEPWEWLRATAGVRLDELGFSVDDQLPTAADPGQPRSHADGAYQVSPKASLVFSPLREAGDRLDLYLNWGHGFHSNDVRGTSVAPPASPVTPLTRAVGEEAGARARLFDRLDLAAAAWALHLDSETTWDGDNGTTAVGPATDRYGLELEARYALFPWLVADGEVSFSHSQFSADHENGNGLALAPKQTWSGGLSARHDLGPGTARAGLRLFGIGDRPASDDGVIVAPGFTQVDLHAGYRTRRWDLALDIENLLNGDYRAAQFDTITRLRTDPPVGTPVGRLPPGFSCGSNGRMVDPSGTPIGAPGSSALFGGCEGVSFTPAYPFTARVMATVFLD
jgi:outer membrane receptor protein involved in Fe transport